jgi:hypothetical protein
MNRNTNPSQTSRTLPATILRDLAWRIDRLSDMRRFARCSTFTYRVAVPRMWLLDISSPGKPALYYAIEVGDLELAEKALTKYKEFGAHGMLDGTAVQWDTFRWRGRGLAQSEPASPVMLAVLSGSMDMLKLVVTHPAKCPLDVLCRGGRYGKPRSAPTPEFGYLHHECFDWDHEFDAAVEITPPLEHTRNSVQNPCESALHWAVRAKRPDMLRLLLENGAKAGLEGNEPGPTRSCTMRSLVKMVLWPIQMRTWWAPGSPPMDLVDIHLLSILHEFHAKWE